MLREFAVIAAGSPVWAVTRDISVPYIGVPLNLIVACCIGAMCSLGYGEPVAPRSRVFGVMVTSVLMGAMFTAIINACLTHFAGMAMLDGTQAGVGGVVSFAMRPFLPWAFDTLRRGRWVRLIPFFRRDAE